MKVSTVMNALPRYAPRHWLEDLRSLAELNSRAQTLPFAGQTPPPANVNLVRNQPAGDINTQKIELQAACGGKKRLAWIFGADAELLELTLKSDENEAAWLAPDRNPCNPVLLLANIRGRQSEPLDAQYAYFIDEFTEESIVHCARLVSGAITGDQDRGGDPVQERRRPLALRIFYALQEYDGGLSRKAAHAQSIANIRENSKPGTDGFAKARNAYLSCTQPLTTAEKLIFNSVRLYIEQQETAENNA
ncbi:MAG: hypothetical protein LBL45_11985, partial [Treponema sp.]|nr:hypothetical protein [Treponema sp.]